FPIRALCPAAPALAAAAALALFAPPPPASAAAPTAARSLRAKVEPVWDLGAERWLAMDAAVRDSAVRRAARSSANFEVLSVDPELPASGQPFGDAPETW